MKSKAKTPGNRRVTSRKQRKQQHLLDVKVRSRAATRQRNRQLLAFLSAVFLSCAAIGGLWYGGRMALRKYVWQNPEYNLAEVEIHTDGPLTRQQVLEATGIQEGRNIFTFNLSNARKGLLALPQVDRADIERTLPNKISIDITERKPVAWITGADNSNPGADPGAFLIDRDGTLMRVKDQVPDDYHLPVICGLPVDNYEEGQIVDLPEVTASLQLIRLAEDNPARYQVRSIDVSKGYCLIVTDDRHAKVTFSLDDIQAQLDRLGLVLANADSDGREIQTVNLLVQRNIPVTFVPPPDPTVDDADVSPSTAAPEATPAADAVEAAGPASTLKHGRKHHAAITVRRAIPVNPEE